MARGGGGLRPVERLRSLALSLERLAARGVAGGALRGAADELRAEIPDDVGARGRKLMDDGLTVLERLVAAAAEASASPPGSWTRGTAQELVRGAVEEMRALVPDMEPTTKELLGRIRLWLEDSASEAVARAQQIRAPGDRARIAAAGAIAGALEQLQVSLPLLVEPAGELAAQIGRGLVRGTVEEIGRGVRRLERTPLFRWAVMGGVFALVLLAGRRRPR